MDMVTLTNQRMAGRTVNGPTNVPVTFNDMGFAICEDEVASAFECVPGYTILREAADAVVEDADVTAPTEPESNDSPAVEPDAPVEPAAAPVISIEIPTDYHEMLELAKAHGFDSDGGKPRKTELQEFLQQIAGEG